MLFLNGSVLLWIVLLGGTEEQAELNQGRFSVYMSLINQNNTLNRSPSIICVLPGVSGKGTEDTTRSMTFVAWSVLEAHGLDWELVLHAQV